MSATKPATPQKNKSPAKKTDKLERSPEEIAEARRLAEENATRAKEVHRRVVDTIFSLVDTVGDNQLHEKLHLLDVGSWDEVVEERYLARLCGFPTCFETVTVENYMGKKYWIQKREKKIYTAIPKSEKFCSRMCYERSNHIQMQLYEEPLWLNWERKSKEYQVDFPQHGVSVNRSLEDIFSQQTDRLLVTRLNELKIAENHGSDSEEDADSEDEDKKKKKNKAEDDDFVSEIKSFVSTISTLSQQRSSNVNGGGRVSTDRNNAEAQKKAAKNKEKFENLPSKEPKDPTRPVMNKERIVKTSGKLETLIQDFHKQEVKGGLMAQQGSSAEMATESGKENVSAPKPRPKKKKIVPKEEPLSPEMEEKLAKLRLKFGKKPNETQRKPPIMVEPPKLSAEVAAKLPEDLR